MLRTHLFGQVFIAHQNKLSENRKEAPGQCKLHSDCEVENVPLVFPNAGHLSPRAQPRHESSLFVGEIDDIEEQDYASADIEEKEKVLFVLL